MPKQIPIPDEVSKPFWDACNERRLIVQCCSACDRFQYPPGSVCSACGSAEHLEWREVSGKGRIQGYCVMHDSRVRRLQDIQPFNIAVIQMDEDPEILFLSHLPGVRPGDVPVGAAVQVDFEEVAPGQLVHEWRLLG